MNKEMRACTIIYAPHTACAFSRTNKY